MSEKRALQTFKLGLVFCAGGAFALGVDQLVPADCAAKQLKFEAYQECLRYAGRVQCVMRVKNFIDYHQLKADLVLCPE